MAGWGEHFGVNPRIKSCKSTSWSRVCRKFVPESKSSNRESVNHVSCPKRTLYKLTQCYSSSSTANQEQCHCCNGPAWHHGKHAKSRWILWVAVNRHCVGSTSWQAGYWGLSNRRSAGAWTDCTWQYDSIQHMPASVNSATHTRLPVRQSLTQL